MANIIAVHAYRGGTGKSNITANLAVLLAKKNLRVGVVDTDIQSPGIHAIFSLDEMEMANSLNDYLWELCEISDACYDVTGRIGDGEVQVTAKYRESELPSPGSDVGTKILEAVREITHIEGHKGKSTMALGIRNDSIELQVKLKQKEGREKVTIKFPE